MQFWKDGTNVGILCTATQTRQHNHVNEEGGYLDALFRTWDFMLMLTQESAPQLRLSIYTIFKTRSKINFSF